MFLGTSKHSSAFIFPFGNPSSPSLTRYKHRSGPPAGCRTSCLCFPFGAISEAVLLLSLPFNWSKSNSQQSENKLGLFFFLPNTKLGGEGRMRAVQHLEAPLILRPLLWLWGAPTGCRWGAGGTPHLAAWSQYSRRVLVGPGAPPAPRHQGSPAMQKRETLCWGRTGLGGTGGGGQRPGHVPQCPSISPAFGYSQRIPESETPEAPLATYLVSTGAPRGPVSCLASLALGTGDKTQSTVNSPTPPPVSPSPSARLSARTSTPLPSCQLLQGPLLAPHAPHRPGERKEETFWSPALGHLSLGRC